MQASSRRAWRFLGAAILVLTVSARIAGAAEPTDLDALLAQTRAQIVGGKSADAYAELAPREAEFGGIAAYDYLYGMAALDSGRASEAVFALGRVVATEPGFDGARMELGRAYFESGDYYSAGIQFAYLRDRGPPAATRVVIDRYLAAIDGYATILRPRLVVNLNLGSGYDSNANGSTADKQFLGFTLDTRNVAISSAFVDATLAANYVGPLGRDVGLIADIGANERWNPSAHFVDQSLLSGDLLLAARLGAWRTALGVNGYWAAVDGAAHEWGAGAQARATHGLSEHWSATGVLAYGPLGYLDERLKPLAVDRLLASARFDRDGLAAGGALSLTLLAGHDTARRSDSSYGGNRYGARAAYAWQAAPRVRAVVDVGGLRSDYSGGGGFFGVARRDWQYSAVVLADVDNIPAAGWRLQPRVRYTKNDSNLPLYGYHRWEVSMFVHRTFH